MSWPQFFRLECRNQYNRTREPSWWLNLIHNIGFDSRHVAAQHAIAAAALPDALPPPTKSRFRQADASAAKLAAAAALLTPPTPLHYHRRAAAATAAAANAAL
jgi:hypothetical protein